VSQGKQQIPKGLFNC